MGTVVALDQYKRSLGKQASQPDTPARPDILGSEIWTRDYTDIEAVVFGLLKVRNIAAFHSGDHNAALDRLCMDALEAAYTVDDIGGAKLKEAIKPLKEWLLDMLGEDNKRDISWALVLCDLIEKSPAR